MRFLTEMIPAMREEVAAPGYGADVPPAPARSPPSFRAAVERETPRGALVVEYKKTSPGRPDLRFPVRSVGDFVAVTDRPAVAAYSCLATGPAFRGSPGDVAELAGATSRPVLFKDFVIDPRQIEVARRAGASAILLIARLETERWLTVSLAELADRARSAGLQVLLEFHSPAELSLADELRADVYGVNVRDLDTLTLEPQRASRTIRAALRRSLHPLLGLSGVESTDDAAALWRLGVDGLLVGTAVARAARPGEFLDALRSARRGVVP